MSDEASAALHIDNAVISVQFVFGLVMSAFAWWIKRQDARLSAVEKDVAGKVSMDVHNATLEALRREIREQGQQSAELMTRTHERIDKLLTLIAEKK
jgi:hypothetical protein